MSTRRFEGRLLCRLWERRGHSESPNVHWVALLHALYHSTSVGNRLSLTVQDQDASLYSSISGVCARVALPVNASRFRPPLIFPGFPDFRCGPHCLPSGFQDLPWIVCCLLMDSDGACVWWLADVSWGCLFGSLHPELLQMFPTLLVDSVVEYSGLNPPVRLERVGR